MKSKKTSAARASAKKPAPAKCPNAKAARKPAPKKAAKPVAKKTAKSAPAKASAKKPLPKPAKRPAAKPAAASKKSAPAKKTPQKNPAPKVVPVEAAPKPSANKALQPKKQADAAKSALAGRLEELSKQAKKYRSVQKKSRPPLFFSPEDAADVVAKRKNALKIFKPFDVETAKRQQQKRQKELLPKIKTRSVKAASIGDILGFNPKKETVQRTAHTYELPADRVPNKFRRQYRALIDLRKRVIAGLAERSADTLKHSTKEDSGDLASYSSDSGTDTFDRDFAFNLVSSEHDLLFEIEQALRRMGNGTYGICEITGKPIPSDRLMAVPFTRHSLEGQRELEALSGARKSYIATPVNLTETAEDDAPALAGGEGDEE